MVLDQIMGTWTAQKGYPVLNLVKNADSYTVSQERFLTDSSAVETDESPFSYKWEVPVTYITSEDTANKKLVWLHTEQDSIEM